MFVKHQGQQKKMSKYLLDETDSTEARDVKGRAKRIESMTFKHIDDFSHVYLCMYLEFLLRLMDNKNYYCAYLYPNYVL